MSLQKNWGPHVLGKMSKTRLVFFQRETGAYDMKNKTIDLNVFKRNNRELIVEFRAGQIPAK